MVGSCGISDLNRLLVIGTEAAVADYLGQEQPAGAVWGPVMEDQFGEYGAFGADSIRAF